MNTNQPIYSNQVQTQQPQQSTGLEDQLKKLQDKWTTEIADLNAMMKGIHKLDELLNIIYTKRQEAVDYYHGINTVIIKQTKDYKSEFNNIVNRVRMGGQNGVRIQNENALNKIAENELIDKKMSIELLANHNNFIKETIQTIDNMIYGINQKVKIAEMMNGIKF
jgi:hypothetical protein